MCQYEPPEGINSVGEHINLEAALYLDKIPDETQKHVRSLIFQCLLKRESCISGCDNMNDIDLLELGSYVELQGGNISLPKGYSSILNPIVKLIPLEKLLLNHEVTKVTWADADADSEESDDSSHTIVEESSLRSRHNSDCPTESQSTPPNRIEVVCNNGVRFIAETVICSLPLGKNFLIALIFTRTVRHSPFSIKVDILRGLFNKVAENLLHRVIVKRLCSARSHFHFNDLISS